MAVIRPLVAYCFAHVRRRPESLTQLNAIPAFVRQFHLQAIFAKRLGANILHTIPDWSTYRTSFTSREKFRRAVEVARESGADLVLADMRELLERTPFDRIGKCVEVLNQLDVDVWDVRLACRWNSMSVSDKSKVVLEAARVSQSRSHVVKGGLRLSKPTKTSNPNANHKNGSEELRRNADRRAIHLREFVLKEMGKLPFGQELSPSALAKALNDAGIASARGGLWSHNTAKDLIVRVRSLGAKTK